MKDGFSATIHKTADGNFIHSINIEEVTEELEALIAQHIVSIWGGIDERPIIVVKKQIENFLKDKSDNTVKGAVSEFIVHLYLNHIGFTQECLFKNLEERSIKKGFDGYYSYSNEEWIMESKSGSIKTDYISHKKKVKEAYDDLKGKIDGNVKNDPWDNALSHANLAGSSPDILNNIKDLSNNFTLGIFPEIGNLNIIPASTIFHEGNWEEEAIKQEHDNIEKESVKFEYNKINIICINKKSIEAVIKAMIQ